MELEHLASRPFSAIIVYLPEADKDQHPSQQQLTSAKTQTVSNNVGRPGAEPVQPLPSSAVGGDQLVASSMVTLAVAPTLDKMRYKHDNPTPIALEPCNKNRAAVLSLILRLPTGGTGEVPIGQTGVAIASALVSLGPGAQKISKAHSGSRKVHQPVNGANSPVFL